MTSGRLPEDFRKTSGRLPAARRRPRPPAGRPRPPAATPLMADLDFAPTPPHSTPRHAAPRRRRAAFPPARPNSHGLRVATCVALLSLLSGASGLVLHPPLRTRGGVRMAADVRNGSASAASASLAPLLAQARRAHEEGGTPCRVPDAPAAAWRGGHAEAPPPVQVFSSHDLASRLRGGGNLPTLLVFGAKQCRMCRMLQPKLQRLAARRGARLLVVHHDRGTHHIFDEYNVTETPTVIVFDAQGRAVRRDVYGNKELPQLDAVLRWGI
ncbi:hypothetical protein AB1Y20_010294 [Prymnesium parvum]|uniref:Thioredoxin domain-containing protein n=1 Tax=Prymnesium parvum TaxID=97485 RepID=A0AB34K705_PRYPA